MGVSFGFVIDEMGVPGLYKTYDIVKTQVESEIKGCYSDAEWEDGEYKVVWTTPIDAWYESPSVYTGEGDFVDSYDYELGEIWLHDA